MDIHNLISFAGMFVLMGVAWLLSSSKRTINWRVIVWGTVLQLVFALVIFKVPAGARAFLFVNNAVIKLLDSASAGTRFVFGNLADARVSGPILAFQVFPAIVFFSALMSILYYYGIMQLVIRGFAWVFTKFMRISGAESLCAAANIFVGIESSLTIRPFLEKMTRSELCVILTTGMATVASSVLALYVGFLKDIFPTIAGHLVSASMLGAPAAIVMAKIILPETGKPETLNVKVKCDFQKDKSLFEAVINGANAGVQLIIGIVALLLAVLGLVALIDLVLGTIGGRLNNLTGFCFDWSLKGLLGLLFYPFALIIGVHPSDAGTIAKIIGERTVVTEVVGYQDLAAALAGNALHYPGRSAILATYALCGFAHIASMAIFVGGTAALVPSRAGDLAAVAVRALIAATLACLMIACVAGVFISGDTSILLGTAR